MTHSLRGMRLGAGRAGYRGGEEVFHLEGAARRPDCLVRGDARDRRFVNPDRVGDRLQVQWPEMGHAVNEEPVLLADDLGCDLENCLRALLEAAGEPVGALQALADEALL